MAEAVALLPLELTAKMKGLPFKAVADDVIRFFGQVPLKPEGIYLKRHPDGRPSGEAFVRFETSNDQKAALQKDRETFGLEKFGDRYVRVYPVLEADLPDMQQAVLQQSMQQAQGNGHGHSHTDSVVKIKSLPFDANQLDIIQFFEGFKLKPNGVQLVVRSDNKPTGEAFVDFESPEEAQRAIRDKDHKVFSEKFGDRYVRLIQVSRKEMQATLALRFGGEGILKMKGIPFKASAADVRKFFASYKIKPDGISFIMHADGRPTGMAFIEFETPQEAVRAMEKDRAKFGPEYGDRFCMLQLVGRHEMDKVQLQKESEANAAAAKNGLLGSMTALQAAALATQAALQNPALQPLLMAQAAANPWFNPAALHLGLMGNPGVAALAGAGQLPPSIAGGLPGAPSPAPSSSAAGTIGLDASALAAQLSTSLPMDPTAAAAAAAANPLLFYQAPTTQAAGAGQDWGRPDARSLTGGLGWGEQLAAAARQTRSVYPGTSTAL